MIYNGIYRYNELTVSDRKKSVEELIDWLKLFQVKANKLVGSDYLKFTLGIWDPDAPTGPDLENQKLQMITLFLSSETRLPLLDMEFYQQESCLEFCVHLKENQILKHLNKGSTYTTSRFKVILHSVIRHPTTLISMTIHIFFGCDN